MVVAFRYQYSNREIIPYVIATLNGILCFLLVLLLGWSNPLDLQATIPAEGRGLNPLLQHIAMVVHPLFVVPGLHRFQRTLCVCDCRNDSRQTRQ